MNDQFFCPECKDARLELRQDALVCVKCNQNIARIEDGISIFSGCDGKSSFFGERSTNWLANDPDLNRDAVLESFHRRELWNMDKLNRKLGVAKKCWWEEYLGCLCNKSVLEIGCGVNYLVPYWLETGNSVMAVDICKESVFLLSSLLKRIGISEEKLSLTVADVERIRFRKKFDVISINNVLHHVGNRLAALKGLSSSLAPGGKLILVEPNYYYPPRWILETNLFDPLNVLKSFIYRRGIIEEGEKAIIFSQLKKELEVTGFSIEVNAKDNNYLGWLLMFGMGAGGSLAKAVYKMDKHIMSKILPRVLAPFEYIIASNA